MSVRRQVTDIWEQALSGSEREDATLIDLERQMVEVLDQAQRDLVEWNQKVAQAPLAPTTMQAMALDLHDRKRAN